MIINFILKKSSSVLGTVIRRNIYIKMSDNAKTISVGQMRATNDKESNLDKVKEIVEISKQRNSCFVFLPECCDFVGENRKETLELSEPLNGHTVSAYKALARENNIWLSAGGIHESIVKNGNVEKIHNSHIIINNLGELVAVYRKLHMFDVETPEFKFRESEVVQAGNTIVAPIETPIGPLGLQICYDMRFPEVSTILRYQGAKILTYPSAFAYTTGVAHWEVLLRSRAIENQCYVIAAAQTGYHNKKRRSYGHAMVVDPWGKIMADGDMEELNVCTVDICLDAQSKIEKNMPCFEHRRKNIYTLAPIELEKSWTENDDENFMFESYEIHRSNIFYCTDKSFCFTNIRCVVPGHVLVATRRHALRLKDMTNDEITDFFQTVCKIQKMLEIFYKTDSSTVTVQDGEHAGQTVKHVHCHIMPRKEGDFKHNDEIYVELNRHDSPENLDERRPLKEMADEASKYRELLMNMK